MEIINLDMTPSTVTPNAHAGQYDASRTVRFMLKNGGVPFTLAGTETITAKITRPDNTEVTVNVANTSSNYVDVVFDDTVCTVKGLYACELRLVDGGVDIGSKNFALLVQRDPYDGAGVHVVTVGPADICTFETTLAEPLQSVTVDIEATGGYDADTQTAHPINGYSSANITRCGVNFLPLKFYKGLEYNSAVGNTFDTEEATDGTVSGNTVSFDIGSWGRKCMLSQKLPSGVEYRLTMTVTSSASNLNYTEFYLDKDLKVTRKYNIQNSGTSRTVSAGFTLNDNEAYIAIELGCSSSATIVFDSPMLNVGSAIIAYTPYNGQTYTVNFGQPIYGCVLDVTRGKLTVDYSDKILMPNILWYLHDADHHIFKTAGIANIKQPSSYVERTTGFICNMYKASINASIGSQMTDLSMLRYGNQLFFRNNACNTVADFEATLTGGELVYELATPFGIDLTPEVISAIVGENNVFADCGETTVKYLKVEA